MSITFHFVALATFSTATLAQTAITGSLDTPQIDRWMYPFAGTPGAESSASIFRTPSDAVVVPPTPAFDDRDAELLLIFNTAGLARPGRGFGSYDVTSLRFRIYTSNEPRFAYDPTFDSVTTNYAEADPLFTADADAGKPIELFAAGFRGGATLTTWQENSSFAVGAPAFNEGVRRVFPALLTSQGLAGADVSNQVRDRFEAPPLSIGLIAGLAPGELAPQGSEVTFEIDLSAPNVKDYFARSFDAGRVAVLVSGLHLAAGGPGGGGGDPTYPAFYTKENPVAVTLGLTPKLAFGVTLSNLIDFNNNGVFPEDQDVIDFFDVLAGGACDRCATIDVNGNGVFPEDQDVIDFFTLLAGGVCCN